MTDFRELIADAINCGDYPGGTPMHALFPDIATAAILATKVPDLCPDCKGDVGWVDDNLEPCFNHPSAPTIEQLLTWGANVARAEVRSEAQRVDFTWVTDEYVTVNGESFRGDEVSLLAALRTEDPT